MDSTRANSISSPAVPPAVGREREQAGLFAALQAATEGQGSLVFIGGEAGIGKTTLVDTLALHASNAGIPILRGNCYDLSTTPPYGPWAEIFESCRPAATLPSVPTLSSGNLTNTATGGQPPHFEEVRTFFMALMEDQPLVVILEDLHWADVASLDLLRYLARQVSTLSLLLIVTYRDDEITRRHPLYQLMPILVREARAQRVNLQRLEAGALLELVRSRYILNTSEDEARLVDYLMAHSEGNPFFAGELLRTLEDDGLLTRHRSGWILGDPDLVHMPPLVRQVVDQRLAKLGETDRRLLEIAAVIGQMIPLDIWNITSESTDEQLASTVERGIERHILEETPDRHSLRFTHALVREALYDGLVLPRRRAMHLRIAETLTAIAGSDPDMIAHHFQQSGDQRAVEWLVRAGDRAQRSYAWSIAADRFQDALTFQVAAQGDLAERGWLLYRIARQLRYNTPLQSIEYMLEAERLALAEGDRVLAAYALFDRGLPRALAGNSRFGIADMEAGIVRLDDLTESDWDKVGIRDESWVADALPPLSTSRTPIAPDTLPGDQIRGGAR